MHASKWTAAGLLTVSFLWVAGAVAEAQETRTPPPNRKAAALGIWNIDLAAVEPAKAPSAPGDLKPVVIVGARNGSFSGKVMVSGPLKGLKASMSGLKSDAGVIGADSVTVRYGAMWEAHAKLV